jgi:hypothetical protein
VSQSPEAALPFTDLNPSLSAVKMFRRCADQVNHPQQLHLIRHYTTVSCRHGTPKAADICLSLPPYCHAPCMSQTYQCQYPAVKCALSYHTYLIRARAGKTSEQVGKQRAVRPERKKPGHEQGEGHPKRNQEAGGHMYPTGMQQPVTRGTRFGRPQTTYARSSRRPNPDGKPHG